MKNRSFRARVCAVLLVFFAAVFLLPAARTGDTRLYTLAAAVPCVILLLLLLPSGLIALDRPLLAASLPLCAFGIMAPAAVFPDEAVAQGLRCLPALMFLLGGCVLVRSFRPSLPSAAVSAACALGVLSAPLLFPSSFLSLAESAGVLLLIAVASFLSLRLRLPALFLSLTGLALMLIRQETGVAAVWGAACVLIFWAASDSMLWFLLSLVLCGGLFAGSFIFSPVAAAAAPDSLLQSLSSMPLILPEFPGETASAPADSLFILLGRHFGLVFLLCALLLLCMLLVRAASLALHTRKSFHASLSLGALLLIGLKGLFFMLSLAGLLPFSQGSFPFITSSLPELCTEFFLLGILSGVSARNEADLAEDARLSMLAH